MKSLKFCFALIAFMLFALSGYSQVRPISDTTYTETRDGVVWIVQVKEFDGGERDIKEKPLGDTLSATNTLVGQAFERFQQYGQIAMRAATELRVSRQALNSVNANLTLLTGKNYLSYTDKALGDEMFVRTNNSAPYTMRFNGVNTDVEIIRTGGGTGALRFKQGGTNFVLDIMSRNWIRIRRYDGSSTQTADTSVLVNLFLTNDGKWVDNNGSGTPVFTLTKKL